MKRFVTVALVAAMVFGAVAGAAFAEQVVASTSWTGAFADAAGAQTVTVLAPYDLAHPPEYELRPSDIRTIMNADLVVYAGYENMVERLLETAGDGQAEAIQIQTIHSMPVLQASIRAIAEALGTETAAEASLDRIASLFDAWRDDVVAYGLDEHPVVVHFHQRALALELGMNVVGVFGPGPLEARQIDELTEADPVLIVDNGHNPIATPIAETTEALVSVWFNFPGTAGTRSLLDIFELNRSALQDTME